MKKICIAFVAAACLLGSCSEDKVSETQITQDSIDISSKMIDAGPKGLQTDITVNSSGDWRLAGVCDWAHPSATEGRDGETVTFAVDPNTSDAAREATFKFFTGSAVVVLEVSSQLGYHLQLLSERELTFSTPKTTFLVKLKTNVAELETAFSGDGAEWIRLVGTSEAFGTTLLEFAIGEQTQYSDRSTTLTITGEDIPIEVAITQNQVNMLEIDETLREYDLEAREIEVDVRSNVEVTVAIEAEGGWITRLDTQSGVINGVLRFSLAEATGTRGGKITISGGGITRVVPVSQIDDSISSVSIPDKVFREWLIGKGWVTSLGGDQCEVTEAGLAATEILIPRIMKDPILSLQGIEGFVNLERIEIHQQGFSRFDISALTKVTSVDIDTTSPTEIILGDNRVESLYFLYYTGYDMDWNDVYSESLVVSGTYLKSLELPAEDWSGMGRGDKLQSIDVSGCPALEKLNCKRFNGVLKTIYMKEGQVIPSLTYTAGATIVRK